MIKIIATLTSIFFFLYISLPSWANVTANEIISSQSQIANSSNIQQESSLDEIRIGNFLDLFVTESFVLLNNQNITKNVCIVAERIVKSSSQPTLKLVLRVLNDPLPLAFSFPGGYVYISTGLLDIIETKDELAAALTHALIPLLEKVQFITFMNDMDQRRTALLASRLLAAVLFLGSIAVGVVAAPLSASGTGTAAALLYPQVVGSVSGITASTALTSGYATAHKIPEKKVFLNRVSPYLSIGNIETISPVNSFFKEIIEGYDKDTELKLLKLSLQLLADSGYNQSAFVSLFTKLLNLRNEYLSKGHFSSLLIAQPGLEGKIEYASKVIDNTK